MQARAVQSTLSDEQEGHLLVTKSLSGLVWSSLVLSSLPLLSNCICLPSLLLLPVIHLLTKHSFSTPLATPSVLKLALTRTHTVHTKQTNLLSPWQEPSISSWPILQTQ